MTIYLNTLQLNRMQLTDLDEVMAIETSVYSHPWSKGNFADSIENNYDAWLVRAIDGELLGYFVQVPMVDEAHLLTIAVKKTAQGQGIGQLLLTQIVKHAKQKKMESISLEVRISNQRAISFYESFGFLLAGRRKNYYEADLNQREDALILRYSW